MEFSGSIPSEHFKELTHILELYSHFSETISLDIRNTQFIIGTVNNSRTAQGICRLARSFFHDYKLLRRGSSNTEMHLTVSCKLLYSLFKKSSGSNTSQCQIRITEENVDTEHHVPSKIFVQRISQSGGKSKSSVPYTDGDRVEALYDHDCTHHFVMNYHLLRQYLARFHPKVVDIVFECTPHTITVQSYWDEKASKGDRPVQSAFTINSIDCDTYNVIDPVRLVVNLKEFKAIYDFMETNETYIQAAFKGVADPIIFTYKHLNMIAMEIALMTQSDENQNDAMEDISMASIPSELFDATPPQTPQRTANNNGNNRSNRGPPPATTPQRQSIPQQQQRSPQQQQSNQHGSRRSSNIGTPMRSHHTTTTTANNPPSPLRPQANRAGSSSSSSVRQQQAMTSPANDRSPAAQHQTTTTTRDNRPLQSPIRRQNGGTSRVESHSGANDSTRPSAASRSRYSDQQCHSSRPQQPALALSPCPSFDSLPSIKAETMSVVDQESEQDELEEEEEPLLNPRQRQKTRIALAASQQGSANSISDIRISSHDAPTEKEKRMTTLEKLRFRKQQQKEKEQAQQVTSPELNMIGPLFDEAGRRIDRGGASSGSGSNNNPLMPFDSNATAPYVYREDDSEEDDDQAFEYINRFKPTSPVIKKRRGISSSRNE